jgi:putative spermidine/putrescine transport system permease protein
MLGTLVSKKNAQKGDAPGAHPFLSRFSFDWLGVAPFYIFALLFLVIPSISIGYRSFTTLDGQFTLEHVQKLFTRTDLLRSYQVTISISLFTAVAGGLFGFLLAWAVIFGNLPKFLRSFLTTFSGVASNFAGIPLAFAFIATMGQTGLLTRWIESLFNYNLYEHGFTVYSFFGLSIVYMYWQFPLMVLIVAPSLDGLRKEWREAAENLGASSWQYWRYVALPILMPALLGTMILLFGNSFGAYATAYALTGANINLVPIVVGSQIQGNVLFDPGLGNALALGMIVVMAFSIAVYSWQQKRTERWIK